MVHEPETEDGIELAGLDTLQLLEDVALDEREPVPRHTEGAQCLVGARHQMRPRLHAGHVRGAELEAGPAESPVVAREVEDASARDRLTVARQQHFGAPAQPVREGVDRARVEERRGVELDREPRHAGPLYTGVPSRASAERHSK